MSLEETTVAPAQSAPEEGAVANPPSGDAPGASGAPSADAAPSKPAKARDYAAVAREQFKLREQRRQDAAARKELESQHAATLTELKAAREQAAAIAAQLEAFKKDPLVWAEKHGIKPDDAIRGFLANGTPEKAIEAALLEAKKAREELEDERTRLRADEEKRQKETFAQAQESQRQHFVRWVTSEAKAYPHLNAEFEPEEIAAQVREIQEWAVAKGRQISKEEAAKHLEVEATKVFDARAARRQALLAAQAAEGESPSSDGGSVHTPGNPGNRDQPQRTASGKQVKPARALSEREQDEVYRQMVKAAQAKDAVARR